MSVRAGIIVTGTEVLSGQVADQNGPWVAARLLDLGVDVAHLTVCGDRPADLTAQLEFLTGQHVDLIVTTGGLGPTADDLTVETVADFCGTPLHSDPALRERISTIIRRWRGVSDTDPLPSALAHAAAKQALVPAGAEPIEPTGTAPGIAIGATGRHPAILILPGPPRELQAMWPDALHRPAISEVVHQATGETIHETIRGYGLSEPVLAETLRAAARDLPGFERLEVTTCMRMGELEIDSRFAADDAADYAALKALLLREHTDLLYSPDGHDLDELLAQALTGYTIATAESCTGGMVAARLTDRAGSSSYMLGGIVSYANDVKTALLGVPVDVIDEVGAVSQPVAKAMADGARRATGADIAVSTSGIAGPGGGSPGKPVGTVCFGLAIVGRPTIAITRQFPGDRGMVRGLATNFALHMVLDALRESGPLYRHRDSSQA